MRKILSISISDAGELVLESPTMEEIQKILGGFGEKPVKFTLGDDNRAALALLITLSRSIQNSLQRVQVLDALALIIAAFPDKKESVN
jgi:hypothetical protein